MPDRRSRLGGRDDEMLNQVQHDGEIAGQARNDGWMPDRVRHDEGRYFGVLAFGVVRVWEKPPPVLP